MSFYNFSVIQQKMALKTFVQGEGGAVIKLYRTFIDYFRAGKSVNSVQYSKMLLIVLLFFIVGICLSGWFYIKHQVDSFRKASEEELASIADLKAKQISWWYDDTLRDFAYFLENTGLAEKVATLDEHPSAPSQRELIAGTLRSLLIRYEYSRILLFDRNMDLCISVPEDKGIVDQSLKDRVAITIQQRTMQLHDLSLDGDGKSPISWEILRPVMQGETAIGAVMCEIDPRTYLFPMILSWPTPSKTAETLLVRKDGDEVVFLNELRHKKDTALKLRFKLSETTNLPAAAAARGHTGTFEGIDYRGVPVFSFIRSVPGTPWFIVAKVDRSEVYSSIWENSLLALFLIIVLIMAVSLSVAMLWKLRDEHWLRLQIKSERESKILAQRIQLLNKHASDIILFANRDWRIIDANDCALKAYGRSMDELKHMPIDDILLPGGREAFDAQVLHLESLAEGVFETVHRRKDGSTFPVECGACSVETGETHDHMLILRDITVRKKAEDELRRSNAELEQFAYVSSHDLQEPLRMISSYTQLLAERYEGKLDERADKYIHYAVDGAKRMQKLIEDLLAYSRVATKGQTPELIDAGMPFSMAMSNLSLAVQESSAVVNTGTFPKIRVDAAQLMLLFQNLIGNALKFHKEGEPPRIHVDIAEGQGEWIFSVKDNGIGIDKKYSEKIFVIFQRLHTREKYPGTGIGLAICKRIVERHGGRIWFESEPGVGTTFYFSIPK